MRFRRKSRRAHADEGANDVDSANDDAAALPPLIVGAEDGTAALQRPTSGDAPTTTIVMGDGLRAPNAEDLIAPAVWDDDDTSEVGVTAVDADDDRGRRGWDAFAPPGDDDGDDRRPPELEIGQPVPEIQPAGRLDARRWSLEDWAAVLIMVALTLIFVDRHVAMYPTLSSPAEVQHLDYAYKASRFEIPRPGDALGPIATETAVCRGIEGIAPPAEDCDETEGVKIEAVGDYNWEAGARSVPYYFATGLFARLGQSVGLFDDFVDGARWAGAVWLALGWVVVWYTMLVLGVERRKRAAIVSVLIAAPLLVMPATFVGSAASLFFVGALVLLATVKYAIGAWSWWSTALVFILGYLFEPTSAPFEIVFLLFLATLAWREPSRRGRRLVFPLLSIGVLAALWGGVGSWISHQIWPVIPRPQTDGGAAGPSAAELGGAVSSGLAPINRSLSPYFAQPLTRLLLDVATWLVSVLVGSVALFGRSSGRITVLARWVLLGLITVGPVVMWQLGSRYGLVVPDSTYLVLPFVAALVVIGGTSLVTRSATIVTSLVGIALVANEFRVLFFS